MIQSTSLSNFRWSFLDAQNNAGFDKAGRQLVSEFRKFMMDEKMENQDNSDYILLYVSKRLIVFQWALDGETYQVMLSKDVPNKATKQLYGLPLTKHERIKICDSTIVRQISRFISDLFTGEDFDIL